MTPRLRDGRLWALAVVGLMVAVVCALGGDNLRQRLAGAPPPGEAQQRFPQVAKVKREYTRLDATDVIQGTEVDGVLRTDAGGHLLLEPDVRRVFDYFLLTLDAEPLSAVSQRFSKFAQRAAGPTAAAEALALWQRYLLFRDALGGLTLEGAADAREALSRVVGVEMRHFNETERQALFAEDNRDNERAVEMLDALTDGPQDATPQERLEAVWATRPSAEMQARRRSRQALDYLRQLQALAADDADGRRALRANYTSAAARRLAALEEQQQHWQLRVEAFAAAMAGKTQGLSQQESRVRCDRALQSVFAPAEIPRVRALLHWDGSTS